MLSCYLIEGEPNNPHSPMIHPLVTMNVCSNIRTIQQLQCQYKPLNQHNRSQHQAKIVSLVQCLTLLTLTNFYNT